MAVQSQHMPVEEFDRFVMLPENVDRLFEYIGGEAVEVVSNQRASAIAVTVAFYLKLHLRENALPGIVSGADGGYVIAGERYIPDVAFVSAQRQPEASERPYSPVPPDLAVEVLSPSNTPHEMRIKVVNYLSVGATVWIVDPDRQVVEVYAPGQPVKKVGINGSLSGVAVLPGFELPVKNIFE
ncbi:Uma2 family endonuclease [Aggregatilinea lenta]|uniref:Uma2 family endonuclease n=1 Tax=Aggregatilinea lenta TaxID=913108 RepID=UPI000E5A194F|nr:Uma2 family endonuclease [Aggregatilinea lenta]